MPWLVLCILRACVRRQLLIHHHKMELAKFERVHLEPHWEQDYKAAAATRRICEVEGEGIVIQPVAQRWLQYFNTREENTKDLPRSEISKLWDIDNIRRILEENPQKSTLGCQKYFLYQKIPYIYRLRHL